MKKISCTGGVRNDKVLHTVKEKRNILQTVKRRKTNWISHILHRNGLIKYFIEGKIGEEIQVMGRQ
jgi:hypothetical protein